MRDRKIFVYLHSLNIVKYTRPDICLERPSKDVDVVLREQSRSYQALTEEVRVINGVTFLNMFACKHSSRLKNLHVYMQND